MGELILQMNTELDEYLNNLINKTRDEQNIINTPIVDDNSDSELQEC